MAIASETRKLTMKTTKMIDSVELFVFLLPCAYVGGHLLLFRRTQGTRVVLHVIESSGSICIVLQSFWHILLYLFWHSTLLNLLVLVTIDPLYLVILRGFCSSNSVKIPRLSSYARRYLQYESA